MIVLAHQWLITYRGGEKVLAEFRILFPSAPLATLVWKRGEIPDCILGENIISSPLQWIPGAVRFYKSLLPFHPWAFRHLVAPPATTLVLSCDASMVKGLKLPKGAVQVCYCNSPPRYLWDMSADYSKSGSLGRVGRAVFNWALPRTRNFDYKAAQGVDHFIANSEFVAQRIQRFYGRQAEVIYPPVSVDDFSWDRPAENYYLLVTQLTPYKRADLAVKAFTQMDKHLIIIGEGSELTQLRKLAGPTVRLLGRQPFSVVKDHFERCRAFLYPQIEDFGITSLEAQAAGKAVIAFRAGGALETVVEGKTGLFFDEQTPESLVAAVRRFEAIVSNVERSKGRPSDPFSLETPFSPAACRKNAERFRPERFRCEIKSFLTKHYPQLFAGYSWPPERAPLSSMDETKKR